MANISSKFLALLMLSFLACSVHGYLSGDTLNLDAFKIPNLSCTGLQRLGERCLSNDYYSKTCPDLENIVRTAMYDAITKDTRAGASILRMFFHDCFPNGCDASVLLDNYLLPLVGEKDASPNAKSLRAFDVIDAIKDAVEKACPNMAYPKQGTVSCADILALAARDAVFAAGGKYWPVPLGRKDAKTSLRVLPELLLPGPDSSLSNLIQLYGVRCFNATELVALSGAHTIGLGQCQFVSNRLANDQNIDAGYKSYIQSICTDGTGFNGALLAPLDIQTNKTFDNKYYENLLHNGGYFHSDQELYKDPAAGDDQNTKDARAAVDMYWQDGNLFQDDFANAMSKLGKIVDPLILQAGENRLNCRKINSIL